MRCMNCSSGNAEANVEMFSIGCNASCCIAHVGHSIEIIFFNYNIYIICEVTINVVHQTLISNQTFATTPHVEEARTNNRLQQATYTTQTKEQKVTSNKKHCYYLKISTLASSFTLGELSHRISSPQFQASISHFSSHAKRSTQKNVLFNPMKKCLFLQPGVRREMGNRRLTHPVSFEYAVIEHAGKLMTVSGS